MRKRKTTMITSTRRRWKTMKRKRKMAMMTLTIVTRTMETLALMAPENNPNDI